MLNANDFSKKQIIFLFTNQGDKLSFSNDNIVIKNKDGVVKHQSTCYRLFMVCVIGHISVTSGLIQRSKKFGFAICLMSTTFRVYEIIGARMEGNTLLRSHQYQYCENNIGRKIEQNKINNQMKALKSIRNKTDDIKDGIVLLEEMAERLEEPLDYLSIMGIEGNAARVYFPRMFIASSLCSIFCTSAFATICTKSICVKRSTVFALLITNSFFSLLTTSNLGCFCTSRT